MPDALRQTALRRLAATNPSQAQKMSDPKTDASHIEQSPDLACERRTQLALLRPIEELRIECGKRHFKNIEEVRFKVVSSLAELVG